MLERDRHESTRTKAVQLQHIAVREIRNDFGTKPVVVHTVPEKIRLEGVIPGSARQRVVSSGAVKGIVKQ